MHHSLYILLIPVRHYEPLKHRYSFDTIRGTNLFLNLQPERVFISEEYEGLKYVIETKKNEATITQTTPEVEKEPESVEKEVSQNVPEPVKSNVISNENTDNDISLINKETPKDNQKNKNKEKEVLIKSSESEAT